ncbi:MAG TPA: hypothetical protein PKD37_03685 [Oligoflexia bacterium]|nr:hypothetical protein [Oligoflexia bacterium]HMP27069.1 hypothetical protein [Oligoflexia bacterium]
MLQDMKPQECANDLGLHRKFDINMQYACNLLARLADKKSYQSPFEDNSTVQNLMKPSVTLYSDQLLSSFVQNNLERLAKNALASITREVKDDLVVNPLERKGKTKDPQSRILPPQTIEIAYQNLLFAIVAAKNPSVAQYFSEKKTQSTEILSDVVRDKIRVTIESNTYLALLRGFVPETKLNVVNFGTLTSYDLVKILVSAIEAYNQHLPPDGSNYSLGSDKKKNVVPQMGWLKNPLDIILTLGFEYLTRERLTALRCFDQCLPQKSSPPLPSYY